MMTNDLASNVPSLFATSPAEHLSERYKFISTQEYLEALDSHGLGMASVRFICGTSDLHLALERRIAGYLGMDDAILQKVIADLSAGKGS